MMRVVSEQGSTGVMQADYHRPSRADHDLIRSQARRSGVAFRNESRELYLAHPLISPAFQVSTQCCGFEIWRAFVLVRDGRSVLHTFVGLSLRAPTFRMSEEEDA